MKKIRGVEYYWRAEIVANKHKSRRKQIGVIAQELQRVFPELVHRTSNGYLAVDYVSLNGVMIEALKGQQKEIDQLKNEISQLKDEVSNFREIICTNFPKTEACQ